MRKIVFDTDPGHDDIMAILTALAHSDELELFGFATVAGNQTLFLCLTLIHHTGDIDTAGQFIVALIHLGNDRAGNAQMGLQNLHFLVDGRSGIRYFTGTGEGDLGIGFGNRQFAVEF